MTTLLILFLVGIALLATDAFAGSLVIAVLGALSMAAGCVVTYVHFGATIAALAAIGSVVLLALSLYAELVLLPKSRLGRGMIVESTSGSRTQPPIADLESLMGTTVVAETTLAPSGYVTAGGRRYEAYCRSGHIPKGEQLRVVGEDNFRLIVTKP